MKLSLVTEKDAILVLCDRLSEMAYFVVTTKEISAEELVILFKNNVWKLYRLLESMISDRELQFVADLTKKLNRMLGIEIKLSILCHLQTDSQTKYMN